MLTQSYSITYDKIWSICNKINVIFAYSEYWVAKTSLKMKQWINWSKTWRKKLTINIRKRTIMNFIKKQIDKKIKEQWLIAWNNSIKKENQKHTARVNLSYRSLKKLQKIDKLIFSTFIQLKMKHNYNNNNKFIHSYDIN